MSQPTIVLKFGGSVLRDESTLHRAVHEIHRWRRSGHAVVAVVSALGGTTEALLQRCAELGGPSGADEHAIAAVLASGELHSAALLAVHLDRAGVPARVFAPGALGLVAEGPPLDAFPVGCSAAPLVDALAHDAVAVVPGFVAQDASGRTVTLGRGGSDLTALVVASQLGAERCRLLKDVDGLYEFDPAAAGFQAEGRAPAAAAPKRYRRASWSTALRTDGSIVQHKAVEFARARGLHFELAAVGRQDATVIGGEDTVLEVPVRSVKRPLRVALLGLGTVGRGVLHHLQSEALPFEVSAVFVRDPNKHRGLGIDGLLTTDGAAALADADVVVEALGGMEPALPLLHRALTVVGAHAVTANKEVVAAAGAELRLGASRSGLQFHCAAAVGGCMPLVERLRVLAAGAVPVVSIRAVLNGTVSFVLEQLEGGAALSEAVAAARRAGYAEGDGARDLSGWDAADKLAVLAQELGMTLESSAVSRAILDRDSFASGRAALAAGQRLRQVATLSPAGAAVELVGVAPDDPLAQTRGVDNAAVVTLADGSAHLVRGKGAGRWPTAEAVLGDLLELSRSVQVGVALRGRHVG